MLKVIGSIMFWAELNRVRLTAGIALNEYAHISNSNFGASKENNIFLRIFEFYSPLHWLKLAMGEEKSIPPIEYFENTELYVFNVESDHYRMHYAEMLRLSRLAINKEMNQTEKMIRFMKWNRKIIFCQYTLIYACLLFSQKIKQLNTKTFDEIIKKCKNQAWDLTYLSFWSTLYWTDSKSPEVFLFGTMDKDLKKIFTTTHNSNLNPFVACFGDQKGDMIDAEYRKIIANRVKPDINDMMLSNLIRNEETNLKSLLQS